MNYRQLYDYGVNELTEGNIAEAALDARLLLESICHTNRNDLLVYGDRAVTEEECSSYRSNIERRKKHEPLQHITGEQEFMGLPFFVSLDVLIPRQDTETLVEEVLRYLHDGMDILDMCTGSGCILLSLLHYSNRCRGVGADISNAALETAKRNADRLRIENCCFLQTDLFDQVPEKYDIIVSNPPYIPTGVIPTLMEEVKEYEPAEALDGREDGLFFYKRITAEASNYLKNGGYLFFEIGFDQAQPVSRLMEKNGYKDVRVIKDLAGHDRVVFGWK